MFELIQQLKGTVFNMGDDYPLSRNIAAAKNYPKLYHCTNIEALKNIIDNHEFWLSTITKQNDADEVKSIPDEQYKNWLFIASFSKEPILNAEHCEEYGDIFVSVKQEWFLPEFYFLDYYNRKIQTEHFAIDAGLFESVGNLNPNAIVADKPFAVQVFSFAEIDYIEEGPKDVTRELSVKWSDKTIPVSVVIPDAMANVKANEGECQREGKKAKRKVWKDEKEIRLKLLIGAGRLVEIPNQRLFKRVCVKLSDNAFDEFDIAFSPSLTEEQKQAYINEINGLFGDRKITYLT